MPAARPVFPSVGAYRSSPFASARPRFSPIAPPLLTPRLADTHGGERNETRTVAWRIRVYMTSCGVICLAFLLYISHFCYISGVLVISLVFLLYIGRSCYISSVPVIWLVFLLYVSYSCYINLFRVILFCRDNAIMGRCA